jgi:RNA polymerase sigma factor (TIGR02999 family)
VSSRTPQGSARDVTRLLVAWSEGDEEAQAELMPILYGELRRLAASFIRGERSGHTLDTSALVHEAYLRLVDQRVHWRSRRHFFSIAARMMRRVLVDHARRHLYAKRGGAVRRLALDEALSTAPERAPELLALDEALTRLAALDQRQAQIVEILGISVPTVTRDWRIARAWLYRSLSEGT